MGAAGVGVDPRCIIHLLTFGALRARWYEYVSTASVESSLGYAASAPDVVRCM